MFSKTNRTIRFKFTFVFASFVTLTLCLFSTILYTLHTHQIQQNIQKSLMFTINQSVRNFFDSHGKFHLHHQGESNKITQFIAIQIHSEGRLLYASHNIELQNKECLIGKYVYTKDNKFLTFARLFRSLEGTFIIRAFYLQEVENDKLNKLTFTLISLVILCTLCSVIGAWYISYKLLAPFREIAKNASRISVENLSERLSYPVENDEVGQLSITLNSLFSRLQNSFTTLKKFTSNASHELKTPLTIMRGDIEVLLRRERSPVEYEQTLSCTLNEIERMNSLIQGLLLLAQAEGEKKIAISQSIELAEIIENTKRQLQKVHDDSQITIIENIDNYIYVTGDPLWIQQIVQNLLNNAFQNTPLGKSITILLSKNANYAVLTIKNTGKEIAKEDIPFVFDRFYRISSSSTTNKGFGLGLAICKALAEKHHGFIKVKSVNNETIFSLYLPLEKGNSRH
ncbi:sensor histidine kinase [Candidatus Uabimicrobium sp. HlEnr_7]|uniref:sensor histidine kinase n=1 Tax=Candidatus Uabimicrobium helgolandensis TaxID=3095367 RepID=UPI003555F2A4